MNKLTAEICKAMIDECKALKERGYLSINGEFKLQALEIALPILEQQERADGEWIEWGGGRRPVDKLLMVEPKLRSGKVMPPEIALYWNWGHCRYRDEMGRDIIAYRVVKP